MSNYEWQEWPEHLERMNDGRIPKTVIKYYLKGWKI
jgi:hypothetical protein